MLKIKFVGAIEGISGSCTWLKHKAVNSGIETEILVDCGLHQGGHNAEWHNKQVFPFDPVKLKFVLLTHAHIDHCGLLPKLCQNGFCGFVYATQATKELAEIMLLDAARINGYFTEADVKAIKWSMIDADAGFKWGRLICLEDDLRFAFLRSSHILGAGSISLSWKSPDSSGHLADKTICFSGDVGCQSDDNPYLPLLKGDHSPFPTTDYIVVESTYGNRVRAPKHQSAEARINRLGDVIQRTVFEKGGKVLLPAFSLHRTQELIMDLYWWVRKVLPASPYAHLLGAQRDGLYEQNLQVLCHSPMSYRLSRVYSKLLARRMCNGKHQYLNAQLLERLGLSDLELEQCFHDLGEKGGIDCGGGHTIRMIDPDAKKNLSVTKLLLKNHIILASAGMCDAGPVTTYLEEMRNDPRNTIIMTGYQSEGTAGRALLDQAAKKDCGDGSLISTQAEVVDMSAYYSAHGDQNQLLDYVFDRGSYKRTHATTVFLNHGVAEGKETLRDAIITRAGHRNPSDREVSRIELADARWFDLDTAQYLPEEEDFLERMMSMEKAMLNLTNVVNQIAGELSQRGAAESCSE